MSVLTPQRVVVKISPQGRKLSVGVFKEKGKGVRQINNSEVSSVVTNANMFAEILEHLGEQKVYYMWMTALKANRAS